MIASVQILIRKRAMDRTQRRGARAPHCDRCVGPVTRNFIRSLVVVLVAATFVSSAFATEKRSWVLLPACRYVAGESNDGDSFRVHDGEKEFVVRLYYADAPEATLTYPERTREQSVHFGATLDLTLQTGARARDRVQELLAQPFVVRTRWANAPGRGRDPRYYAIVEVQDRSLAEILVAEGLARAKGVAPTPPSGEKVKTYLARLRALEDEARQARRGAWAGNTPAP